MPAVRVGPWKYIPVAGSGGWAKGGDPAEPEQLYNLAADIGENKNLAAAEPGRVEEAKAALAQVIDAGRSTPGKPQANDVPVKMLTPASARPAGE